MVVAPATGRRHFIITLRHHQGRGQAKISKSPLLHLYVNFVTDQLLANYNALTSHSSVWIFLGILTPLVLKLICTFSEIPVFKSKKLDTPPM